MVNIGNNNEQKLYFTDVNADGLCMRLICPAQGDGSLIWGLSFRVLTFFLTQLGGGLRTEQVATS